MPEKRRKTVLLRLKAAAGVLLALAGGVAIAGYLYIGQRPHYPVARVAAPDGLTYTAFADETRGRDACIEANDRFISDFRAGCPTCIVEFSRCESKDEAIRLRVGISGPLVVSRGMSVAVAGPHDFAAATCQSIVQDLRKRGIENSRCLSPSNRALTPISIQ